MFSAKDYDYGIDINTYKEKLKLKRIKDISDYEIIGYNFKMDYINWLCKNRVKSFKPIEDLYRKLNSYYKYY